MSATIVITNTPSTLSVVGEDATIVVDSVLTQVINVVGEGPQGIQGVPGIAGAASGDLHYTHTQSVPQAVWTVTHNLGKKPSTTVIDATGEEVFGNVDYIDNNSVVLTFIGGFSGTAIFN